MKEKKKCFRVCFIILNFLLGFIRVQLFGITPEPAVFYRISLTLDFVRISKLPVMKFQSANKSEEKIQVYHVIILEQRTHIFV